MSAPGLVILLVVSCVFAVLPTVLTIVMRRRSEPAVPKLPKARAYERLSSTNRD